MRRAKGPTPICVGRRSAILIGRALGMQVPSDRGPRDKNRGPKTAPTATTSVVSRPAAAVRLAVPAVSTTGVSHRGTAASKRGQRRREGVGRVAPPVPAVVSCLSPLTFTAVPSICIAMAPTL